MADELFVNTVTRNRDPIRSGEFVRVTVIVSAQSGLSSVYEGDLVINVNGDTVHTEIVSTGFEDVEVEVPIRLEELGTNFICAFMDNVVPVEG